MKASIIKIGNSRGVRIPKPLFELCGIGDEVEIEVHQHELIIRATHQPREGWEKCFAAMAVCKDDALLDPDLTGGSSWDEKEWEWK